MPTWLDTTWGIIGFVAWLFLAGLAAGHAVMYKRDPRSSAIWVLLILLLPYAGPWLYWVLGINRLERRVARRLGRRERPFDACELPRTPHPPQDVRRAVGHLEPLLAVADRVTRLPLLPGNTIEPLHNGEQAYPRMMEAIRGAEKTVTLVSYIFDSDEVGFGFADALSEAASRGVRVHLLVDGLGALGNLSRMGRHLLKTKVETAAFFPLRFPFGRLRINLRNHRKLLVVDGHIGFTGGMNISQRHLMSSEKPGRSEDLHFEIAGPVVAELQHAFVEDWALATDRALEGEEYFPVIAPCGSALCRGISTGPDEDLEMVHCILLAAIAAAKSVIYVVTPYFVPTMALISALTLAALRGVRVVVLLPSEVDHRFLRWVADAYLWQLLEHGIEVYRRPPPFVHTKLVIVDGAWVLLGSANMDRRSFRLNFEFNVEAYDTALARELSAWLETLLPGSGRVTLEEVDARSTAQRLRDGAFKLLSPHL